VPGRQLLRLDRRRGDVARRARRLRRGRRQRDRPKGLTRELILRGPEGSLGRLGGERIDLYNAHEDDPATPLAETLAAFGELMDQGLVRAIAASNYPAERLAEALDLCAREGLGVAAYFALARGS
jgi:aryl-alcohol dehydrogenase-like predicted oxidoreductase